MTTVDYGDIASKPPLGQLLASVLMILGYGILAVPTGIVSVQLARTGRAVSRQACPACGTEGARRGRDPLQVLRRSSLTPCHLKSAALNWSLNPRTRGSISTCRLQVTRGSVPGAAPVGRATRR
jgi:hypothetical protein